MSNTRTVAAAIGISAAAISAFSFLPILTAVIADDLGLVDSTAGMVVTMELFGFALAALVSLAWNGRVAWRPAAVSMLVVLLAGNLFSITLADAFSLAGARFVTGFASGSVYSLALNLISRAEKPERAFAAMVVVQVLLQALGLALLSHATLRWGVTSVFVTIALLSLLALVCVQWLPSGKMVKTVGSLGKIFASVNWIMLLGLSLYFINIGIVWTFIERIGAHSGLGREFIGLTLSISILISLAGAVGASFLGGRYGRTLPIVLSGLGQILAIVFLLGAVQAPEFIVAALLYAGLWSFIVPFQYSAISESDDSGSSIMLAPAWQAFGIALGPALAG